MKRLNNEEEGDENESKGTGIHGIATARPLRTRILDQNSTALPELWICMKK